MLNVLPNANEYLDQVAQRIPLFAAGLAAHREGRMTQARAAYLELIDQPNLVAICLHQLGVLAGQTGDHGKAVEMLRRAIRIDDSQPIFHYNLASALEQMNRAWEALDVLVNLGVVLQVAERHADAVAVYNQVLSADPCRYAAYINRGTGLALLRDPRGAVDSLVRGVALHAQVLAEARAYLDQMLPDVIAAGTVSMDATVPRGMPTGPVEKLEHALTTLGKTLSDLAHPHEAILSYYTAIKLSPGLALAHWNLSLSLLSVNNFKDGWAEYMWRWYWDRFPEPWRRLTAPSWRGESLEGKTLGVFGEQGFGDIMQFAPLIFDVEKQQKTAKIVLEVPTPLVRLLKQSFEPRGITVIARTDDPHKFESPVPLDYTVPLMSLPHLTGLTSERLPLEENYLVPLPEEQEVWAERLKHLEGKKIGIVWAGRPAYSDDAKRTIGLERFRSLFDIPGISWVSLQYGHRTDEPAQLGIQMYDPSPFINDFADTAALVSQLDQVICVDTGTGHLASILGIPTWILLPKVPDWRWLLDRTDTNWYPRTRLFRQSRIGEWDEPMNSLREALLTEMSGNDAGEGGEQVKSRKRKLEKAD
jgi:tetratricopeptide (TPR) repeat protein